MRSLAVLSCGVAFAAAATAPPSPPPPGGLWDWTGRGDFRAVVTVSASVFQKAAGGPIAAVVEWRRRDADPKQKAIIVTDSVGQVLTNVSTPVVEQHAGVIVFNPNTAGTYYVYYMPYTQSGIGSAKMNWIASTAGGGGDWQPAGNFSGKAAVRTRQDFVLPNPVTAKKFRWTCLRSWGSNAAWQGFVVELSFRTATGGWLANNASIACFGRVGLAARSWTAGVWTSLAGHGRRYPHDLGPQGLASMAFCGVRRASNCRCNRCAGIWCDGQVS